MNNFDFSPFPLINTDRLILRQLKKTDSRYLYLMRNNPKVSKYLDRPLYKDLFETAESIEKLNHGIGHNNWIFWAIENEDGKFVGTICLWNYNHEFNVCDIGFELDPKFQGNGYMTEAIKATVKFAFDIIKLNGIWGFTVTENESAINILTKNNFKQEQIIEEVNSKGIKVKLSGLLLTKDSYKPSSYYASL
ncbi:MAG: GNAT family protein [Acidaminobacteraceae bacterium]